MGVFSHYATNYRRDEENAANLVTIFPLQEDRVMPVVCNAQQLFLFLFFFFFFSGNLSILLSKS